MREFLAEYGQMLAQGAGETLYMTAAALFFSYLLIKTNRRHYKKSEHG